MVDHLIDSMAAEVLCPIRHELPVDPVVASDGFVYDRLLISEWLRSNETSPMTNLPMSTDLADPPLALRNHVRSIATYLSSKDDPRASEWKKKLDCEAWVSVATSHAKRGTRLDADCMHALEAYRCGYGVTKDEGAADQWTESAASRQSLLSPPARRHPPPPARTDHDRERAVRRLAKAAKMGPARRMPARVHFSQSEDDTSENERIPTDGFAWRRGRPTTAVRARRVPHPSALSRGRRPRSSP